MSASVDKMQRTLLMVMPVVFVFFIARFPAGLVLYWVTTNLWTVGQGLITRRLDPEAARAARSAPRRTPPQDEGDGGGNGAKPEPSGRPPAQPGAQPAAAQGAAQEEGRQARTA